MTDCVMIDQLQKRLEYKSEKGQMPKKIKVPELVYDALADEMAELSRVEYSPSGEDLILMGVTISLDKSMNGYKVVEE